MSIYGVGPFDVETFTLSTNPQTYFTSGSQGVTGALYLHSRRSTSIKQSSEIDSDGFFNDSIDKQRYIKLSGTDPNNNSVFESVNNYFSYTNNGFYHTGSRIGRIKGDDPYVSVKRMVPEYTGSLEYVNYIKSTISGTLMPGYNFDYTNCELSYANYHSLNFISSSTTPTDTALIYPNVNSCYELTGAFTINFHINVRNKYENPRPGTILHMSGNYAISVIPGSSRDINGLVDKYGILLQLSDGANFTPTDAITIPSIANKIFNFDNILQHNTWHDVTIKWGTKTINNGVGYLYVDLKKVGEFKVDVASLSSVSNQVQLVVGNFYEGPDTQKDFFTTEMSRRYGIKELKSGNDVYPFSYGTTLNHVGYFELHNINFKAKYISGFSGSLKTPNFSDDYKFFLPPWFIPSSSFRYTSVDFKGGVPIAANYAITGSTSTPFNLMLSVGSGAHIMNLENHLMDFANFNTPFQVGLVDFPKQSLTPGDKNLKINDFFYQNSSVAANNLLILPCDDGNFTPFYRTDFKKKYNILDKISLVNYVSSSNFPGLNATGNENSLLDGQLWRTASGNYKEGVVLEERNLGFTPKNPYNTNIKVDYLSPNQSKNSLIEEWVKNFKTIPGKIGARPELVTFDKCFPSAQYWKFFDSDSNQLVFFDISNLYYGDSIQPNTFVLSDTSLTGSNGNVSMTIKDNGHGGLYRADCLSTPATFNNVGNIFYNEGIVVLKNPSLYFVGKDSYTMTFKGQRNIHVLKIDALSERNAVNLSTNSTYIKDLRPSADQIDSDDEFVYITGINFHDDNFNVIARAKLAQPIIKRNASKIGFKIKVDF